MRASSAICLTALAAALALVSPAEAATYSNPTQIGPVDNAAAPPSSIAVSGEQGTTTDLTVSLLGVIGGPARDLDVQLVGPGASTILLSDVCSAGAIVPDFNDSFSFNDAAPSAVPETCNAGEPTSGTYRPSNYGTADSFPAMPPPYPVGLSNFRGVSPVGTWSLYVVDDQAPDPITITGGWSLSVTTTGAPAVATTGERAAAVKKCKKKKSKKARKRCRKRAQKLPI